MLLFKPPVPRPWGTGIRRGRLHGRPLGNGLQANVGFKGRGDPQPSRVVRPAETNGCAVNLKIKGLSTRCCGRMVQWPPRSNPGMHANAFVGRNGDNVLLGLPNRLGPLGEGLFDAVNLERGSSKRARAPSMSTLLNAPLASTRG